MLGGLDISYNIPNAHPSTGVNYPPYFNVTPKIVTSWSEYESIVENSVGAVIINTHGEYLPVPGDKTWGQWVDTIAEGMSTRRMTWVHCGGYTFYRVWWQLYGDEGEWTEQNSNNVTIGSGFKRLMSCINLPEADLWPPAGADQNPDWRVQPNVDCDVFRYWQVPCFSGCTARIGRPLKYDDFSQYITTGLYRVWTDNATQISYYPAAVISFCNASDKYTQNAGSGSYVHVGLGDIYNEGNTTWINQDFVRGFVGTAAAIEAESMGFQGKSNSDQEIGIGGGLYPVNATYAAMPMVSSSTLSDDAKSLVVKLIFPLYGAI